jgi:diguanylate cyclase (GGDEF)-like protein
LIPWELIRGIAVVQLYIEEKFIEPPSMKKMPLSLMFQQTLSILASSGENTPKRLAEKIFSLSPFSHVEKEDYRELLISIDPMTQLNNRTHMEDFLDGKMKSKPENKELYVFIMDLDYFKQINDEYGHLEGDEAIIIAANTIRSVVDRTNYFACRYGGDEFVVVCETSKDFKPKEFLNHINECLKDNAQKEGKAYTLKFSVGYKKYSAEYTDVREYLDAADKCLYDIKKNRAKTQ